MDGARAGGPRVVACTALIVPPRGDSGLDQASNWVVLVRSEIIARARQRMLANLRSTQDENGNGSRRQ